MAGPPTPLTYPPLRNKVEFSALLRETNDK